MRVVRGELRRVRAKRESDVLRRAVHPRIFGALLRVAARERDEPDPNGGPLQHVPGAWVLLRPPFK